MRFMAIAETDIGNYKSNNQDSLLIKHALAGDTEVMMAIVCDGMGGLARGELASATVIKEFSKWFDNELALELENLNLEVIGGKWAIKLKELNQKIVEFSRYIRVDGIGTTFTGILMIDGQYVVAHVGDSRLYQITNCLQQITVDQTFVEREISLGRLTPEQAKVDKRRNLLLQCVGASKVVDPQIIYGYVEPGVYMLCSDGFRHEITPKEIYETLNPALMTDKQTMTNHARYLIQEDKRRNERDNISVIVIKVD